MAAMDADLQLKMSKKIAQLTKVIFLLNTKNEDAASELQATAASHRRETEAVARDAAAKMASLKESLEKKEAALKGAESLKKIKDRHRTEKQEALAQFQGYKDEVTKAAKASDDSYKRELQAMADDVKKVRAAFHERVASLKASLDAVQAKVHHGSKEADALRKKHSDEVADMVTASNQKYNDMLTAQLNEQDELRAQCQKQLRVMEEAHRRTLVEIQEKTELDMRMAVKRRELECNTSADTLKNEMVSKMERLLAELETLRGSETQLRSEKQVRVRSRRLPDLETQLSALKASSKQVEIEFAAFKKAQQGQSENAEVVVQTLKTQLNERDKQMQLLQDEVQRARLALEAAECDRTALAANLDAVAKARDSNHMELSEKEAAWALEMRAKETELAQRIATLKAHESEVKKLRELIKTNDAHAIKTEDDLKKQLLAAQKKLIEFQAKESELNARVQALKTELAQLHVASKERLDKAVTDANVALAAAKAQLEAESAAALRALEARLALEHQKQIDALMQSAQHVSETQKNDLESKTRALQAELTKSQGAVQTAQDQLAATTKDLAAANKDLTRFKGEAKLLAEQLKLAETASTKEAKEFKQKLGQLEGQRDHDSKALQKERTKCEAAQADLIALRKKLETLTKGHDDALATLRQAHQAQVDDLRATMQASIAKAVEEAQQTMQSNVDEQRGFLLSMHASDLAAVQSQIDVWKQKVTEHEASNAYDRAEFHKLLQAQDDQFRRQLASLEATQRSVVLQLGDEHAAAMASLREAHAATIAKMQQATAETLSAHQAASATALAQAHEAFASEKGMLEKLLERRCAEYDKQIQDEASFHAREVARQVHVAKLEKDREREMLVQTLSDQHRTVVASKEEAIEASQRLVADQADAIRKLQDDLKTQAAVLEHKQDEWRNTQKRLAAEKTQALEGLARQHKAELEHLLDEHVNETQLLNAQFEKTRGLLQEQQQVLIAKVREWEAVYARRDSRVEDVNRISELEQEVATKDALVQQTVEEMAYIKRELLNREDTYNKTFGRSPNVGVLQVLKPTTLTATPPSLGPPPKLNRKTKPQSFSAMTSGTKPLPPIGASNQQPSYRDLNHLQ
ncbi:hypothetical protein SPRG_10124 [Saprolegnia parasitica CBS 223.65]|uniref:Protein FAM184A/B N-terminal domain-containing protein n=1 Tax=Saprolegnia parasitica (strain CBS 223.65) TaxID=695850 RepID=A0A067C236_SAPPC|nr:hypothetical protein SPRG_10124 [Saprolegnia parasitica CBS 223.65]KDO24593.1 hypothetical protein SPRG_10124 [Saprolegnia parasitica CBS 223.65]|eukprot:XP_012204661.1 hypothetical protein SPRG_10124 [Saprolegnia parasitica CBS 223.65]